MLRSSTQLAMSHGDELGLEYLWNWDEYNYLENSFKAVEKNAECRGQQEVLAPVHVASLFTMRPRQRHCIWRIFTDCPSIDILYYPEERDNKGELIKAGQLRVT